MTHSLKAAALRYAADGWPVFMLGRNKRPVANCHRCQPVNGQPPHDPQGCKCLTCHGFYAATLDPRLIGRMIASTYQGMLAIRTGAPSRLVVIDVDPRNGGNQSLAALQDRGMLPPTRYVCTGNSGLHLYYRHPGPHVHIPGGQIKLGAGIDVKADGGYVVAPPAIHPVTWMPYRWADPHAAVSEMAPALRRACRPPTAAPPAPATPTPQLHRAGAISNPAHLLAALLHKVRNAPAGRTRVTLYGCARGVAKMAAAGAISPAEGRAALLEVGLAEGQTERSALAAIDGGFHAEGVTV